jgi:hypothetical protein
MRMNQRGATMTQEQLLSEFRRLSMSDQIELVREELRVVQFALADSNPVQIRNDGLEMSEAAKQLVGDYENDSELTSFTALDGEPFHAPR